MKNHSESKKCLERTWVINGNRATIRDPVKRFWSYAGQKTKGKCWLWTKSLNRNGYGVFSPASGKVMAAHRYAYSLVHGPIPNGLMILHTCDNPDCVNPEHLKAGTQRDNMRDRSKKNRGNIPTGQYGARAKLTEEQVCEIRRSKETGNDLAKKYGVHFITISGIRTGRTWKHLLVKGHQNVRQVARRCLMIEAERNVLDWFQAKPEAERGLLLLWSMKAAEVLPIKIK